MPHFAEPRSADDHLANLRALLGDRYAEAELRASAVWMAQWLKPYEAFCFSPYEREAKTDAVLSDYFAAIEARVSAEAA